MQSDEFIDEMDVFIEPLPEDEIETALITEDIELNVRAWNTVAAQPEKYRELIEKALTMYLTSDDDERKQIGEVYATHFSSLGMLSDEE